MSFKGILGFIFIFLGIVAIRLPFTREFTLISILLIGYGAYRIARHGSIGERLRRLLASERAVSGQEGAAPQRRIDPLLPVRVLKLAEARSGVLTVSIVAMALNVGLDECQIALDELVRKGAASVDVDIATGVSSYLFPEFLPHPIEGAGPL